MDKMKLYTVIDLFAGAGGLSEGFVQGSSGISSDATVMQGIES